MGKSRVHDSSADLKTAHCSIHSSSDEVNERTTSPFGNEVKKTEMDIRIDNSIRTDPRDKCCWGGQAFVDALKAMITRQMFLLHAMLVLWRTTEVMGAIYWLFAIPYIALIIEAMFVLLYRRAKEWKWFSFCVFGYLICVVPPIWFLELDKIDRHLEKRRSSAGSNDTLGSTIETSTSSGSMGLDADQWVWLLEQTMLVIIIIGRWLLPKGDLSREQLSSLLLNYAAIASDIVDFFGITNEDDSLKENKVFVYSVLTLWTWSLMQFPFVSSMQKKDDGDDADDEDTDDEDMDINPYLKHKPLDDTATKKKKPLLHRIKKKIHLLLQTEAWVICLSLFLQDFPFLIVRLATVFKYNVLTETNYFFICKNSLTTLLQIYRLYSLYRDHIEALETKKKNRHKMLMDTMYRWAFVYGKIKRKSRGTDEKPTGLGGIDYSDAKNLKHFETQFVY